MPSIKRRTPLIRSVYAGSPRVLHLLLSGVDFGWLDPSLGPEGTLDAAELAAAWDVAGEFLMGSWQAGGDCPEAGHCDLGPPRAGQPWGWHVHQGAGEAGWQAQEWPALMPR